VFSDNVKLFGNGMHQFVNRWQNDAHEDENIKPTVKHGRGSIMQWGYFDACGTKLTEFIHKKGGNYEIRRILTHFRVKFVAQSRGRSMVS